MSKTSKTIRRALVLAGISVMAASASAVPWDARINIDRALNSPTLTVRYSGANAALVELRLNGESLGTRSVTALKDAGETNFDLNLSLLKDGDNDVEIRLYDRTGKLVGSDKTNISTDQTDRGPVFLRTPKVGQTVMGSVDIDMGFGRDLKNVIVSFFVDNNFKKMTNYPPYTMSWDTLGEANGWHEVEAWAVDESSTTYKTRKTRIFVNNPGGRTERPGVNSDLTPAKNPTHVDVDDNTHTEMRVFTTGKGRAAKNAVGAVTPHVTAGGSLVSNSVRGHIVESTSGLKPAPASASLSMGAQSMTPTNNRNAKAATQPAHVVATKAVVKSVDTGTVAIVSHPVGQQVQILKNVEAASSLVRVTKGQHFPGLTTFAVVVNSQFVNFDVEPRVDGGVPMTPFRHLIEKAGGSVKWEGVSKTVKANADGRAVSFQIGEKNASINDFKVNLEVAPYIDRGRSIVPLSFIHDALNVDVEFDKETNHVLIKTADKK